MPSFFQLNPLILLIRTLLAFAQFLTRYPTLFFLFFSNFLPLAIATMELLILADKETGESIGLNATSNFVNQVAHHIDAVDHSSPDTSGTSGGNLGGCVVNYTLNEVMPYWTNEEKIHCSVYLEKFVGNIYSNASSLTQQALVKCLQIYRQDACAFQQIDNSTVGTLSAIAALIIIGISALLIYCCCRESAKNGIKNLAEHLQSLAHTIKDAFQTIVRCCRTLHILDVERGENQRLIQDVTSKRGHESTAQLIL